MSEEGGWHSCLCTSAELCHEFKPGGHDDRRRQLSTALHRGRRLDHTMRGSSRATIRWMQRTTHPRTSQRLGVGVIKGRKSTDFMAVDEAQW
jgi:hypothetical protein